MATKTEAQDDQGEKDCGIGYSEWDNCLTLPPAKVGNYSSFSWDLLCSWATEGRWHLLQEAGGESPLSTHPFWNSLIVLPQMCLSVDPRCNGVDNQE